MTHTKGPWRQVRRSATIAVEDPSGDILGEVYGKTTRPETEWHANAHLIAAAPDLLAACRQLLELSKELRAKLGGDYGWEDIRAGEAAVALAEGD